MHQEDKSQSSFLGHTGWINALAITSDGKRAISCSYDKKLKLWDINSGEMIACFYGDSSIMSCEITPDGMTVIAGEQSGQVHFLRLDNNAI